jgi:FixJ family two-component response regulator
VTLGSTALAERSPQVQFSSPACSRTLSSYSTSTLEIHGSRQLTFVPGYRHFARSRIERSFVVKLRCFGRPRGWLTCSGLTIVCAGWLLDTLDDGDSLHASSRFLLGDAMTPTAESFDAPRHVRNEPISDTEVIRVALIEDDEPMRQALIFQLSTAGFQVAAYASAEQFFEASATMKFDCIVADIYLPRMNGLQLQEKLNRTVPYASIVFISGHGDLSLGMHAMRNGAVDFLEKPVDDKALLTAITRGAALSRRQRAAQVQLIELEKRQNSLTPREREAFALIIAGLLNKQVGVAMGTTERTVKAHRARIMSKMGANSLADLVHIAGILQIHPPRPQSARMR